MPAKPNLRLVPPKGEKWKVPGRKSNRELRTKEYLTPHEVEKLIEAAKGNRNRTETRPSFSQLINTGFASQS